MRHDFDYDHTTSEAHTWAWEHLRNLHNNPDLKGTIQP